MTKYKKGRQIVCFPACAPVFGGYAPLPAPPPIGPFKSCGDCPYAAVGFKCWSEEGVCLRNHYGRKKLEGCVEQ